MLHRETATNVFLELGVKLTGPRIADLFNQHQCADKGFLMREQRLVHRPDISVDIREITEQPTVYTIFRDLAMASEMASRAVEQGNIPSTARLIHDHPQRFDRVARIDQLLVLIAGTGKIMIDQLVKQLKSRIVVVTEESFNRTIEQAFEVQNPRATPTFAKGPV